MNEQRPRVWIEKFFIVGISFQRCHYDHSIFVGYTTFSIVFFVLYVNNILLTGSYITVLTEIKDYFKQYFITEDMRRRRYFREIKEMRTTFVSEELCARFLERDWFTWIQNSIALQ